MKTERLIRLVSRLTRSELSAANYVVRGRFLGSCPEERRTRRTIRFAIGSNLDGRTRQFCWLNEPALRRAYKYRVCGASDLIARVCTDRGSVTL